jgi:hypothetical protein
MQEDNVTFLSQRRNCVGSVDNDRLCIYVGIHIVDEPKLNSL